MNKLRILEPDPNRRGDLFGRLMADLFVALGYEQPRINIHKSGREIDLSANHRLEQRRAIGECKATEETTGGADLNKFVGVLDAEQGKNEKITGYFISLAGFKETAIEQERQRRKTKIVTLTGEQVVNELIKGRIIIAEERATELAGRCCAGRDDLKLDGAPELVAHDRGWIWIIYYSDGKIRTRYVLIHADGTPLAITLARQISASDQATGGCLHKLICLNPHPESAMVGSEIDVAAMSAYGRYIAEECGNIQLDGLPADSDVGSRRLKLENLFVPLHIDIPIKQQFRQTIGAALKEHSCLAVLAAPGGGKSTLIKRIAVAYANPERRALIHDELPERNWLPLFFRCRELRGLARASFSELLDALAQREPVRQHALAFRAHVDRALADGRVLLLVDGLDEISDPGDRAAFVCTMRTALQAYPSTAIIVTSREAGFRHVAAHLAPVCTPATLSPFDADDIRRLSVGWHKEVVSDSEKVRTDAEQLARTISGNDRIQRLAVNPLLLTTLLLVKRWVGSLPTRRAVLYGKAVEVLLITWNTEGHEPIPEEEALPQLCYVASAMMIANVERISRPSLAKLIQEARHALPTELGYVKGTVEDFIHRVEDRSSLLMMTGHDIEDARIVEFFEFRHLTFQEFLTAKAMVSGWHPGRGDTDTLVSVLEQHFDDEKWREVIPLAASLGGKSTEKLINHLTEMVVTDGTVEPWEVREQPSYIALGHCLADEAAARPETIRSALRALLKCGLSYGNQSFVPLLVRGRYGEELRDEAERLFLSGGEFREAAASLMQVVWSELVDGDDRVDLSQLATLFTRMLTSTEFLTQCKGGLACVELLRRGDRELGAAVGGAIAEASFPLLFGDNPRGNYVAGWVFFALGTTRAWNPPLEPDVLGRMFNLWRRSPVEYVRGGLCSTLIAQTVETRDGGRRFCTVEYSDVSALMKDFQKLTDHREKSAALLAAWYTRALNDAVLVRRAQDLLKGSSEESYMLRGLLNRLGVESPRDGGASERPAPRESDNPGLI